MNNSEKTVFLKTFTRDFMKEHGFLVFKDRELVVESDSSPDKETTMYRFKIGDGVTTYDKLNYVSSLYSIFPNVKLYNRNYTFGLDLKVEGDPDVSG